MSFRRLVKTFLPGKLFRWIEPYGHLAEAVLAQTIAGFPARNLKVVGVTGTDGKSTTVMLIAQMLRDSGHKVAMLSTISVDYGDGSGQRPSPNHMTTASAWRLVAMLKKIRAAKAEWLVLEVSSHALSQFRVWSIPFSIAVYTNLSHEHLDYHGNMKNYRQAKLRLFKQTNRNRRGLRTGIINADDPAAASFVSSIMHPITYGIKSGVFQAKEVKSTKSDIRFKVNSDVGVLNIKSDLVGEFNVYNLLATAAVGRVIDLSKAEIERGLASLKQVPGRMMSIDTGQAFGVYIDYAVTPNALKQSLAEAKKIAGRGSLILVFGATGDRDRAKRPVMGQAAAASADKILLTDDETHTEDPQAIRDAVYGGIKAAGGADKCQIISDRRQAIQAAFEAAKAGDVVLITGLGHQTSRNMGGKDEAWSDIEVAKNLLKK